MKKLYFLVLMICSVCTFTACSDKDDAPKPQIPVTGLSVPPTAAIGEEVNILGTGFSSTAALYVKDAQGKKTDVTVSGRLATGLTVTFPATLTAGDYTLFLVQDGEWELGKITLTPAKAPLPITDLKMPDKVVIGGMLVLEGKNFPDKGEYFLQDNDGKRTRLEAAAEQQEGSLTLMIPATLTEGAYTFILKVGEDEWKVSELTVKVPGPKRLKTVSITDKLYGEPYTTVYTLSYNAEGKVNSIKFTYEGTTWQEDWSIEYASTGVQMKMTGKNTEGSDITSSMDMTLADGKVSQNIYLNEYEETNTYPWTYEGDYMKTVQYGAGWSLTAERYVYKNGDIDSCAYYYDPEMTEFAGSFHFYYEGEQLRTNGAGGADLVNMILFCTRGWDKGLLFPNLLGLSGKAPAHLPTKSTGGTERRFTYLEGDYVPQATIYERYYYSDTEYDEYDVYVIDLTYEAIPE